MEWWQICLVAMAAAFLVSAFAAAMYVIFKFAALVVSLDSHLLHQFKLLNHPRYIVRRDSEQPPTPVPEDGGIEFVRAPTDEEAFLNEKVEELQSRSGGTLTTEELDAFVRQAVGSDVGSPKEE